MLRSTLLMAIVVVAACDSRTSPPKLDPARPTSPTPPDPTVTPPPPMAITPAAGSGSNIGPVDVTASGEVLYAKLCSPCHGADARGYAADNAPSLISTTFLESATDDFLHRSTITGRPGSSMGAYGKPMGGPLDDAAIDRIVAFLRAKGPMAKPLDPVGPGDVARGKKLFDENCKVCHGDNSARSTSIHLANAQFLTAASDPFLKYAIINGRTNTKMLAFGTVLEPQQVDDLVAYIRSFLVGAQVITDLLPEPTGKEPLVLNPNGADPNFEARENRFVPVDAVAAAFKAKKKFIIIDARPSSDWRRVHITGAVSIPYLDTTRLKEVPLDVTVIAYCACPHHLSGEVVDALISLGHKKAYILDEGINEWHRRLLPVVAAKGVEPPPPEPNAPAQ